MSLVQAYEYTIVQWLDPTEHLDPDSRPAHLWRVWRPGAAATPSPSPREPVLAEVPALGHVTGDPDRAPEIYQWRLFDQLGREGWQLVEGVVTADGVVPRGGVRQATTRQWTFMRPVAR